MSLFAVHIPQNIQIVLLLLYSEMYASCNNMKIIAFIGGEHRKLSICSPHMKTLTVLLYRNYRGCLYLECFVLQKLTK